MNIYSSQINRVTFPPRYIFPSYFPVLTMDIQNQRDSTSNVSASTFCEQQARVSKRYTEGLHSSLTKNNLCQNILKPICFLFLHSLWASISMVVFWALDPLHMTSLKKISIKDQYHHHIIFSYITDTQSFRKHNKRFCFIPLPPHTLISNLVNHCRNPTSH